MTHMEYIPMYETKQWYEYDEIQNIVQKQSSEYDMDVNETKEEIKREKRPCECEYEEIRGVKRAPEYMDEPQAKRKRF